MAEPTFQIVFRGKILGGFDRAQVRSNLAQMFRSDPARIDALLDAPKTVLKTGLTREAANRYQEALRAAGIMVAVIGEGPAEAAPVAVTPGAPASAAAPGPAATVAATAAAALATPTAEAPAATAGTLTLAEVGVRLLPPKPRVEAAIDTSGMSLAAPGTVLADHKPVPPPQIDLSALDLAPVGEPIDKTPRAPPRAIDTSALSLAERPPEPESEPSELQKLLSSSVE